MDVSSKRNERNTEDNKKQKPTKQTNKIKY